MEVSTKRSASTAKKNAKKFHAEFGKYDNPDTFLELLSQLEDLNLKLSVAQNDLTALYAHAKETGVNIPLLKKAVALRDSDDYDLFVTYLHMYNKARGSEQ